MAPKNKRTSLLTYSLLIAGFLAILIIAQYLVGLPRPGIDLAGQLTKTQEKSIDLVVDLSKILISWGVAVIGAFVFFFKRKTETRESFNGIEKAAFMVGTASAIFSLLFGYIVIQSVANSLSHNVWDIRDPSIEIPAVIQFFTLTLALGGLSMHVFLSAANKKNNH